MSTAQNTKSTWPRPPRPRWRRRRSARRPPRGRRRQRPAPGDRLGVGLAGRAGLAATAPARTRGDRRAARRSADTPPCRVAPSTSDLELTPPDYAVAIADAAPALRAILGLDALFLIAYAVVFMLLPRALGVADEPLVRLGVGAMLTVAALDAVEDHHLAALARLAEHGLPIDSAALALQHVISQVKFHASYAALVLVAVALPRRDPVERAFAWSLGLPLPLAGALAFAWPAAEAAVGVARWGGFMAGFVGAIAVLTRAARAPGRADAAAATGARA
jgi:hypothetical protein